MDAHLCLIGASGEDAVEYLITSGAAVAPEGARLLGLARMHRVESNARHIGDMKRKRGICPEARCCNPISARHDWSVHMRAASRWRLLADDRAA